MIPSRVDSRLVASDPGPAVEGLRAPSVSKRAARKRDRAKSAEYQKLYRARRKAGLIALRLQIPDDVVDDFVVGGWLPPKFENDRARIAEAASLFLRSGAARVSHNAATSRNLSDSPR